LLPGLSTLLRALLLRLLRPLLLLRAVLRAAGWFGYCPRPGLDCCPSPGGLVFYCDYWIVAIPAPLIQAG
jgi:hypothetical protein